MRDRTQPGELLKIGRCGAMTCDHGPNGTAIPSAVMRALDRIVFSTCDDRRLQQKWLEILRGIDDIRLSTNDFT